MSTTTDVDVEPRVVVSRSTSGSAAPAPAAPGPVKKRAKMWMKEIDNKSQEAFDSVTVDNTLKSSIERKLYQAAADTPSSAAIPTTPTPSSLSSPLDLDLDHILSQLPYQSILENYFSSNSKKSEQNNENNTNTIPVITKAYEESFMRQPHHNENACVMGSMCECQFLDSAAPFTAVEFRLFHDTPKPQMCVLCSRRTTQKLFYDMCLTGKSPCGVIQRYGNIFGQPGEYSVECMLACPNGFNLHCMPLPIMSHQRNKYSVHTSGGHKYLQQHRVAHEHFQTPSATSIPLCAGVQDCAIPDVPEGEPPDNYHSDSLLAAHLHPVVRHTVAWLQHWAKTGLVSSYIIERRLNMYLALPALIKRDENFFAYKPWFGLMYVEDVPCFENIPNLWRTLHECLQNITTVRKKNVHRNMLYQLFTHALPCFHQTNKVITVDKYVSVALNVLLAMLLGLYRNVNRKPHFVVRMHFFSAIHALHTSSTETQQRFFSAHPNLLILAFMEYAAQITPIFWPAEHQFLLTHNNLDTFFAKIPLLCDEFRVFDVDALDWAHLEQEADSRVHKCSRSRRLHRACFLQQQHQQQNHIACTTAENREDECKEMEDHDDDNHSSSSSSDDDGCNDQGSNHHNNQDNKSTPAKRTRKAKKKLTPNHHFTAPASSSSASAAAAALVLSSSGSSGISHWRKRIPCNVSVFLNCPTIVIMAQHQQQPVEQIDMLHHLLAHAFQAPEQVLRDGHSLVQVHALPNNIRDMQVENLLKKFPNKLMRYIRTRLFVCMHCLYHKNSLYNKFRLHMHDEQIVCSECLQRHVVSVDVLGRTVVVHGSGYILCPCCCTVHPYVSDTQRSWIDECCNHVKNAAAVATAEKDSSSNDNEAADNADFTNPNVATNVRIACDVCNEDSVHLYSHYRVNLATAKLEPVSFCYKHNPNEHVLKQCVNVQQLKNLRIRRSAWMSRSSVNRKPVYDY